MTALEGLTALEREQLRYIVQVIKEWPHDAHHIWVDNRGFTLAQYEAMKAEMASPPIDYRAHCEALAAALENARAQVVAWQGEPHPYSCTIHKAVVAQIDEALTRWKEDSK